ncbi:hypothetical protein M3Y99_01048400 [Aphelenchoides fujianensis]|nr:hypothetical protein M3Y99_01048400 [Aphelenchoides fujianensis]
MQSADASASEERRKNDRRALLGRSLIRRPLSRWEPTDRPPRPPARRLPLLSSFSLSFAFTMAEEAFRHLQNALYSIVLTEGRQGVRLSDLDANYRAVWATNLDADLQKAGCQSLDDFLSKNHGKFAILFDGNGEQRLFVCRVKEEDADQMKMIVDRKPDPRRSTRSSSSRRSEFGDEAAVERLRRTVAPLPSFSSVDEELEAAFVRGGLTEPEDSDEDEAVGWPKAEGVKTEPNEQEEEVFEEELDFYPSAVKQEAEETERKSRCHSLLVEAPPAHPATRTMRADSPNTYRLKKAEREAIKKPYRRYAMVLDGPHKIHRVILPAFDYEQRHGDEAAAKMIEVEVVGVLSPSCVWIRRRCTNSEVTRLQLEMCTLRKPFQMHQAIAKKVEQKEEEGGEEDELPIKCSTPTEEFEPLVPFGYYLAPRLEADGDEPELVYSRARLLEIRERRSGTWCFVHFIDHGYGQWVLSECLGEMPLRMTGIPWLCTPIALFGFSPVEPEDADEWTPHWTVEHSRKLAELLAEFPRLFVRPVVHPERLHTYNDYTRVEIWGREVVDVGADDDCRPADRFQSINTLFASRCNLDEESPVAYSRHVDACGDQQLFPVDGEIPEPPAEPRHLPDFCTQFPDFSQLDAAFALDDW